MPANIFFPQKRSTSTNFGLNIQGASTTDESDVCDLLNVIYIRDAIRLYDFRNCTGAGCIDTSVQAKYNRGLRVVVNLNWEEDNQPRRFCTDRSGIGGVLISNLTTYRNTIAKVLEANKQYIWCAVIENEPDNFGFYNYNNQTPFAIVQDYVDVLTIAVDECKKRDIKVMDGATHVAYYNQIKNNPNVGGSAGVGKAILTACGTLDVDYINTHWNVPSGLSSSNSQMALGILRTWSEWVMDNYHHRLTSNEWHQQPEGTPAEQQAMLVSVDTEVRKGHFPFCIIFAGDPAVPPNNSAIPITDTNFNLNALGTTYKNSIASGV